STSSSSVVLVTDANGHVAQHIVAQLLERGAGSRPKIKATVRSGTSAIGLKTVFADALASGSLEVVQIVAITSSRSFDSVLDECTYVAHVASPLVVCSKDVENEALKPAIRGTISLMYSTLKCK
ncbi:hypothetical protein K431DRAFT_335332, partial [Polychaeton citri CBS 116435]